MGERVRTGVTLSKEAAMRLSLHSACREVSMSSLVEGLILEHLEDLGIYIDDRAITRPDPRPAAYERIVQRHS